MSKIDEFVMAVTLARGDLEFAISKACQAKIAEAFGGDRLVDAEMGSAREAIGRASDHLREL